MTILNHTLQGYYAARVLSIKWKNGKFGISPGIQIQRWCTVTYHLFFFPFIQLMARPPIAMGTLCTAKKHVIYGDGDTLHWQKAPHIWQRGHFALPKSPSYMAMGTLCTAKKPLIYGDGDTLQCQKAAQRQRGGVFLVHNFFLEISNFKMISIQHFNVTYFSELCASM